LSFWDDFGNAAGTIGGIAFAPGYLGYKAASGDYGSGPQDWLMGDPKVGLNPNDARLQDADFLRATAQNGIYDAQHRQAPQVGAAALDQGAYNQWRQQQLGLAQQLGQVATGQQAGAGELAVNRQFQNALAANRSAMNSARGANSMLAARAGARAASDMGVNGAGMAQTAAMQDQVNARQQLAGVLGQGAQQDIGIAAQNAGFAQQSSLSNQMAQLQMTGLNQQASLAYLSAMTGIDQAELQARLQQEQLQVAQRQPGHLAEILQMGGQIAAAHAGKG
jgi:hypothetical protein